MSNPPLRVLLIEDDEDDFVWVRTLLSQILGTAYELEWVTTYSSALEAMQRAQHDVYLLDYRLGDHSGLNLLYEMSKSSSRAPIIFLTGQGDYEVDLEAMRAGAADYLVKSQVNAPLLDRSIRYAVERKRSEDALRESEKQLRYFSSQLLAIQEEERKRVAGELHDSIGPSLSAIKFILENTLEEMEQGTSTPDPLKKLISLVQHTVEESRRIVSDLRPLIIDDLGIILTIHWFCREFHKTYSSIHIDLETSVKEREVADSLKMVIFRVIQEAFHNIAKYSEADKVNLSLVKKNNRLELMIRDNGKGFELKEAFCFPKTNKTGGLGLTSMRERTELSGGSFSIESASGKGTVVHASWICA